MYNRDTGSAKNKTNEGIWGMEGNLTKGPILKTLTKLAIPIMASSFLGTLYNITDMAWIGLLGSKAVAGVGVGGMFTWFSQGLASMSRMGGQVQVAQCIGRGDKEEAHKYAQTAVQLATLMGLLFAAVMLLFLHPLVGFFQLQDPEALQAALSYTKIACGLIVFSFLTLTLTGIYTAQGDSKTPFIANFIGLVTREMKKGANRGSQLSPAVDYLLVYAKSLEKLGFFYEPFDKDYIKTFKFDDGDGKGAYKKVNLYEPTLDFYANCRYEIKCPDGEIVITPEGKSFRCNKESFYEDLANNGICFEKKKSMLINSNTGETANWCVYTKLYLKDMLGKGRRPSNLFLDMINANGTKELTKLKLKIFEFSKPVGLIKYLIKIISNTNIENNSSDIILDFFSGSATTAQAVMEVNTELNSNRKFIMIQLPELCNEKSKAYKAGYKNICEIGKERIRRAGKKIVEETGETDLDIGFRVLKLDESNMKDVYYTPDELSQSDLINSISNIKEGRSGYDLLYQCMLDWGLELSLPHRMERINNNEVHIVNDGDLIACFDDKIPEETVKQIANLKPLRVVFRDSSFATPAARINVDEIFKLKSPQTTIKVL